jgi:hypothetical protein
MRLQPANRIQQNLMAHALAGDHPVIIPVLIKTAIIQLAITSTFQSFITLQFFAS